MKLLKKIPFDFENTKYEIRILFGDNTMNIAVFRNNYPANGFRRQIKLSKENIPENVLDSDVLAHIVERAKNDIFEKRWDKFISGLK